MKLLFLLDLLSGHEPAFQGRARRPSAPPGRRRGPPALPAEVHERHRPRTRGRFERSSATAPSVCIRVHGFPASTKLVRLVIPSVRRRSGRALLASTVRAGGGRVFGRKKRRVLRRGWGPSFQTRKGLVWRRGTDSSSFVESRGRWPSLPGPCGGCRASGRCPPGREPLARNDSSMQKLHEEAATSTMLSFSSMTIMPPSP